MAFWDPISSRLTSLAAELGKLSPKNLKKLANTRGPTWRKIPDAEKAGLTEARALALLEKHSSAIKRPVLEAGSRLLVGFEPGEYQRL